MKKIMLVSIMIFSLLLSGCGIKKFFIDEFDKADLKCDEIVQCLEAGDKRALKRLFSKEALENATDIEEGCKYIINEYSGKFESKERTRYHSQTMYDRGKHSRETYVDYKIITSKETYHLSIYYWPTNTIMPTKEGLYRIILLPFADTSEDSVLSQQNEPKIDNQAGIYNPDWEGKVEEE